MPLVASVVCSILVRLHALREKGAISQAQARALKAFLIRSGAEAIAELARSTRRADQVANSWVSTHLAALLAAAGDGEDLGIGPHPRSLEREKQKQLQIFHSAFHRILSSSLFPGDTAPEKARPLYERVSQLQNISWRHILAAKRGDLHLEHDGLDCRARVSDDGEFLEWHAEGAATKGIHLGAVEGVRILPGNSHIFELLFQGKTVDRFTAPTEEEFFTWVMALASILSSRRHSAEEGGEEGQSTNDLLWQAARVRLAECDPGQHLAEAVEGVETILHDVEKQCGPVKRFVVMA